MPKLISPAICFGISDYILRVTDSPIRWNGSAGLIQEQNRQLQPDLREVNYSPSVLDIPGSDQIIGIDQKVGNMMRLTFEL